LYHVIFVSHAFLLTVPILNIFIKRK